MDKTVANVVARFKRACGCQPEGSIVRPSPLAEEMYTAVAPPGWEDTVKHMKKHPEIDNPWALAWHMKNKGDTPHHASDPKVFLAANVALKAAGKI